MDGTSDQIALWYRLESFTFDVDGSSFPFSQRLARDNGWSHSFSIQVIDEYRRFVFLAMEAGHPVTPSDEVDQAWHLHLTYTRSYWDHMCAEVLHRPLHHGPTKGGSTEQAKFGDWYDRTLESYERFFGQPAPRSVWPSSTVRFGEAQTYQRVNGARNWVIRKPQVTALQASIVPTSLVMVALLAQSGANFDWVAATVGMTLAIAMGLAVLKVAITGIGKANRERGGSGTSSAGCAADDGSHGGDSGGSASNGGSGCGGCGGCGG